MSDRERMAARGQEGCELGLPMLLCGFLILVLRNQVAHGDHGTWLLLSAGAVAWALVGTAMALSGWLMLLCATRAPDSLFEAQAQAQGRDEDEDRP